MSAAGNSTAKMSILSHVEPEFGYVIFIIICAFILNFFQTVRISMLRRSRGIAYPAMWSDQHPEFNLAQRAHQNTLEVTQYFLTFLLVAGLRLPAYAAVFGAIWVVGRFIYSIGYYYEPKWRIPGYAISTYAGLVPLLALSIYSAVGFLGWA